MKRKLFLSILIVLFTTSLLSIVGCNNQTPTKEQKPEKSSVSENKIKVEYDLQDKCGQRTSEFFKKEYGNGVTTDKDGHMMSGYQNHYNKKLNKCFILITSKDYPKDKKTDVLLMKNIYDFNENKEYGSFSKFRKDVTPSDCNISEKTCNSEQEWDLLVKPYMEE